MEDLAATGVPRWRPRVLLAWLSGPMAVAAGLAAHVASGGLMPALALLLTLTALLGLAASMLARLRLPGWSILVLCGLVQQLLHFAFSAFVGGTADVVPAHGHGAAGVSGPSTASAVPGQDLHSMLYAHAAAALLSALIAARGTAMLSWVCTDVRRLRRPGHPGQDGRPPLPPRFEPGRAGPPTAESGEARPRKTGPAAPHGVE
ncbi:hypothetical protein [Arthrobacter zhaoguopingii]|uniref:hypothetical protein n=1 Tax=Arthrobacter zhaoguopingii TaxID=2681491 RepID=UPI001916181F|nr:hypothetical protein [Arthrobacter zhaoguopingii]